MKFIKSFNIFENVQQAKSILKSLESNKDNNSEDNLINYNYIREILKGHDGYVGWFTNLFFTHGYDLNDLRDLLQLIKDNRDYISKLDKNIIEYDNIEKLQDDIEKIRLESSVRRIYNEFPTKQRSFINLTKDIDILRQLSRRKDIKGFFKKVSSYHDRKTLLSNISIFLKSNPDLTIYGVEELAKKKGSDIKYVSHDDDILIVRVYNAAQLNAIAGDASWCIRNSGTFDNYVHGTNRQYIIFLFNRTDRYSKIGVTLSLEKSQNNFFSTAHDIYDGYMSYKDLSKILSEYKYDISQLNYTLDDIDVDKTPVQTIMDVFNLSKEDIVKIKNRYVQKDINLFTKEEIDKWGLLEKSIIDERTMLKYSFNEIISKNLFKRLDYLNFSTIIQLYIDNGYEIINYLKKNQSALNALSTYEYYEHQSNRLRDISDYNFYKDYILKHNPPTQIYDLSKKPSMYSSESVAYYQTMFRILWYKDEFIKVFNSERRKDAQPEVKRLFHREEDPRYKKTPLEKTLNRLFDEFDYVNEASIKYCVEILGFDIGELYSYLIKQRSGTTKYMEYVISYCKKNNINFDKYLNDYYDNISYYRIEDSDLPKYKKILPEDKYEELLKTKKFQEFKGELGRFGLYDKNLNKTECQKFYDKWNDYLQENLPKLRGDDKYINPIIMYLIIDKLDELPTYTLYAYSGQSMTKTLCDVVCDDYKTNGGMRHTLTNDDKKKLYEWFIKQNLDDLPLHRYGIENGVHEVKEHDVRYYYQRMIAMFDEKELDNYFTYVSKLKYNYRKDDGYSMTGKLPNPGDRTMYATNRISEIGGILETTRKHKSKEKYVELIQKIIKWNLLVPEIKQLLDYFSPYQESSRLLIDEMKRKKVVTKTIDKYEDFLKNKKLLEKK